MSEHAPHVYLDLVDAKVEDASIDAILSSLAAAESATTPFGAVRIALSSSIRDRFVERIDPAWRLAVDSCAIAAANLSIAAAAREGKHLLVLNVALAPPARSLSALERVLETDPYFAFIKPRASAFRTN